MPSSAPGTPGTPGSPRPRLRANRPLRDFAHTVALLATLLLLLTGLLTPRTDAIPLTADAWSSTAAELSGVAFDPDTITLTIEADAPVNTRVYIEATDAYWVGPTTPGWSRTKPASAGPSSSRATQSAVSICDSTQPTDAPRSVTS